MFTRLREELRTIKNRRVVRRPNVRQMLVEAAKRGGDEKLARALDRSNVKTPDREI